MRIDPNRTFLWMREEHNDGYIDNTFIDKSPNADLREWRLSFDTKREHYYATLQRAKSAEDPFESSVQLPRAMVKILLACL